MVYVIGDGFDTYSAASDAYAGAGAYGGWTSGVNNILRGDKARFGYGGSIIFSDLTKTGGPNHGTYFFTMAMNYTGTLGSPWGDGTSAVSFILKDSGTSQMSMYWGSGGSLFVYSGAFSTLLLTVPSAFLANSWDHWQVKCVIHPTAGEVHIRKNGSATDNWAITGVNTRAGTANNYANEIRIQGNNAADCYVDDVLIYTGTGNAPNDWVGDVRCYTVYPTLDTAQKQFTPVNVGTPQMILGVTTNSGTPVGLTAGEVKTSHPRFVTEGGTFTSVSVEFAATYTGNVKLGLYLMDGNTQGFGSDAATPSSSTSSSCLPGTLVAVSNAVTNPTTGANTFTFASTVGVLSKKYYCWALLGDATVASCLKVASSADRLTYTVPGGYAAGFPTQLATLGTWGLFANADFTAYTTLTVTNAGYVSENAQDGTTTYLQDSTVGHYDLYDMNDLNYTPVSVIGVNLKAHVAKTDAGARGFKIAGKSGATTFETAEFTPLTTFSPITTFYNTDPNTSATWTQAGVAALQIGPKLSS